MSIDAKRDNHGSWQVYVEGGRKNTGIDAMAWAKEGVALGAGEICMNSMDADGEKAGFDLELNRRLASELPVPIIASGGAGTMQDLRTSSIPVSMRLWQLRYFILAKSTYPI